ncbi:ABC transporter substrate-binding protein [soil metagenome]
MIAVAAAAVLVVGLAACAGSNEPAPSSGPRILKIGTNAALTSLDPALSSTPGVAFLSPVYESLIRRDADGILQKGLATDWKLSDDATELSLTLREGVTFQDGAAFDATAVKTNLDAAPKRGGRITSELSIVKNVEVVDATHVKLTMSRPAADILGVLAGESGMMISPAALASPDLATKPVGTGPFTVDSQNQTGINYAAWDGYWNKDRIKLDRIEILTGLDDDATRLNAVLTGEVQVAVTRYSQIAEQKQRAPDTVVSETATRAAVIGIMLNTAQGKWADAAMRKAAMHAIDRQGISDALFDGGCEALAQPFPTNYWANDPSLEKSADAAYDPNLARKMLKDAGLTGVPVKLYVGSATLYQNIAAAVQEQLNAVGMNVTVESLDNATLSDLRAKGEFEASVALVQPARPDPSRFVTQFYTPKGTFNYGHTVYTGIDKPLAAMNATVDQDKRAGYMHEIMKQILEQGPTVIPICSPTEAVMHSSKVDGVEIPVNYDNDWTYVYFKGDK